jgi:hypothetical protein
MHEKFDSYICDGRIAIVTRENVMGQENTWVDNIVTLKRAKEISAQLAEAIRLFELNHNND